MASVSIEVLCEVVGGSSETSELESVRNAATMELEVIAQDLELDAEFHVDVRTVPDKMRPPGSQPSLVLCVDGNALSLEEHSAPEVIRIHLGDLITPRFVDHIWTKWGGTSVAPPDFQDLVRNLVRHRVRPNRVSYAVAAWPDHEPLRLFEEALGQASRKISVHVHPERVSELSTAFVTESSSPAAMMADGLFYELGVTSGRCELVQDPTQRADSMRVRINDLRSGAMFLLAPDECAVNDTVDRLTLLNIEGREVVNPANGSACAIIPKADADIAERAGLTTWKSGDWTIVGTSSEVKRSAAAVLNLDAVESLLDELETAFPYLVSYVRKQIGVERFARVLRHLLDEGLSIRNMRHVIDGLALMPPPHAPIDSSQLIVFTSTYTTFFPDLSVLGRTPDLLALEMAEQARANLKRYISHKYSRDSNTLVVYLLDSKIEQRLANRRPLSAADRRWFLEAVRAELGHLPPTALTPCLLTTMDIRRRVKCEIEASLPQLAVLSYQELSPDLNIQPIARISPDGEPKLGPLDLVDEAISEVRYENAEQQLRQLASVEPLTVLNPRIEELSYLWNEAGRVEHVVSTLAIWLEVPVGPTELSAIKALIDHPESDAVRRWLAARDPLRVRRLRAKYLPAIEDLVYAKGGGFSMGEAGATEGDRPSHTVEVGDFGIAPWPVTGGQFALYLMANGRAIPQGWVQANNAVRGISWIEAIDYCNWLSRVNGLEAVYNFPAEEMDQPLAEVAVKADHARNGFRLATEAEWEYAARGGRASHGFRFAGSDHLARVGDATGIEAVASRLPNELRLYDMSGGRAEWCWDWYSAVYYSESSAKNPMGPSEGTSRVCRGGDIAGLGNADACTVFGRESLAPHLEMRPLANVGFRIARTHDLER
jgi:formylglycine-generating enzyme required for sulfatase activity